MWTVACLSFTFHYASTLSRCPLFLRHVQIDLHSTMLLLYRFHRVLVIVVYDDLHSTMLLLYPDWLLPRGIPSPIYIPLCFYFIGFLPSLCTRPVLIYIPLCFYFIRVLVFLHIVRPDLHSTMLLLYPVPHFHFFFLQYENTFCPPCFYIGFSSKIFLLPLYKIWIFLDISSFVYLPAIFLYLRSTITRNYLSYHHPLPRTP